MGLIPEHVIDQVREAHAIEEVIGRHVELKRAGSAFKARCPFHDEKTPSFHVNTERQTFKCFGCGKGGNVFTFLVELLGLSFPEAVRMLADERAIQIPTTAGDGDPGAGRDHKRALHDALSFAHRMFQKALASDEGAGARTYLVNRGYDAEAVDRFGLGFAPPGWDRLVKAAEHARIPVQTLVDAGLVQERPHADGHYDRFRNRVIFPVRDLQSRVVTFGARALDPEDTPKYLNGPETDVFYKSATLFGLDIARTSIRETGEALLMEGYTDVLMAHLFGFDRAVAGMGTALTERQAGLIGRFASRVVLVYDADDAGIAAAERGIEIVLEAGMEVRIAHLPAGRDVDEILLEEGAEGFAAVLDTAQELFDFKLDRLSGRFDLRSPRGRAEALEALVPTLACVKRALERDQLFQMVAERLGGGDTERALRREVALAVAKKAGGSAPMSAPDPGEPRSGRIRSGPGHGLSDAAARTRAEARARDERRLIAAALDPKYRDAVFRAVGPEDFTDPVLGRLYRAVLDLEDAGQPYDLHLLITRTASDADAAAALADLPDGPDFEELLDCQLRFLEQGRRAARHRTEFQALAAQFGGADSRKGRPDPRPEEPPTPTPSQTGQHPAAREQCPPSPEPPDEGNVGPLQSVEDPVRGDQPAPECPDDPVERTE